MTDLRDALKAEIGQQFEASGHRYDSYLIEIAADAAIAVTERWTAKEPAKAAPKPRKAK